MFNRKSREELELQMAITKNLIEMDGLDPEDEAYAARMKTVERLNEIRTTYARKKFSPDALLAAGAAFGQVLLIVAYEQKHVFTSKAASFISKSK